MLQQRETHFNGDSNPFSASARIALSNGVCTLAHAKSHSIKLCAHFDAINSKPELNGVKDKIMIYTMFLRKFEKKTYPTSLVIEQPDINKCFRSQVGNRMRLSCVKRAQPLISSSCNFVLVFRIRCRHSSLISRDSAANDATDSSSRSGKPGESICINERKILILSH